jgi:NAD(P)H-hydrate repair Nnr-like enzyme with NAD(P)H-hydrate dehydratase domain
MRAHGRFAGGGGGAVDAVTAGREAARTAALRAAATRDAGVKGDGGLVVVLAGMTAGLVAQALPGPDAAILSCYLVGTAGSALARDTGPGWLSREPTHTATGP